MGNKFKAKVRYVNGIKFDSVYESLVYEYLVSCGGFLYVDTHVKLPIPTTRITWEVDFRCGNLDGFWLYETKGFFTEPFKLKLQLLKDLAPDLLSRLAIISENKSLLRSRFWLRFPEVNLYYLERHRLVWLINRKERKYL